MNYTITIPDEHLVALLKMLESVPAPMHVTLPIHQNMLAQKVAQDNPEIIVDELPHPGQHFADADVC